jgi:ribosomal-protein-alanine N-acetyltransferase
MMCSLFTPRLRLLSTHEALAPLTAAFLQRNAAHLAPWEPPRPADAATLAAQHERLRQAHEEAQAGSAHGWWLQRLDAPDSLIGQVTLSQVARGPFQNAMLGYALDAGCQGQGLMREALQAVIHHAFGPTLNLHRLQANVRPENTRSLAVLQALGFEYEGRARDYLFIDGAWRDHCQFALRNTAHPGPLA